MDGEQSCHQKTSALRSCGPPEEKKQKHAIDRVQKQAIEVMAGWGEAKDLHVQGMGEPSQRMPIPRGKCCECPTHRGPFQSGPHVVVFRDVDLIVVINEAVPQQAAINHAGESG
jgi:hypothetical protein